VIVYGDTAEVYCIGILDKLLVLRRIIQLRHIGN